MVVVDVAIECFCCSGVDHAPSMWHFSRRGWRRTQYSEGTIGVAYGYCPDCFKVIRLCQADMEKRGEFLASDGRIRIKRRSP